jgi:hypothetical protein
MIPRIVPIIRPPPVKMLSIPKISTRIPPKVSFPGV